MNVVAVASARGGESGHRLPSGPARRIVRPRAHKTDVEQIEQLDDTTVRWNVSVMGADRTFEAEITEQEPDKRIAWKSRGDTNHAGVVTFHRIDDDRPASTPRWTSSRRTGSRRPLMRSAPGTAR